MAEYNNVKVTLRIFRYTQPVFLSITGKYTNMQFDIDTITLDGRPWPGKLTLKEREWALNKIEDEFTKLSLNNPEPHEFVKECW